MGRIVILEQIPVPVGNPATGSESVALTETVTGFLEALAPTDSGTLSESASVIAGAVGRAESVTLTDTAEVVDSGGGDALAFPGLFATSSIAGKVAHVTERFTAYSTPSVIASTPREDGGHAWDNNGATEQSFLTSGLDPWFGQKALRINFQDVPGTVWQRGLVLDAGLNVSDGGRDYYVDYASADASLVTQFAFRWTGTRPYVGKILDRNFVANGGNQRYNMQSSGDPLGLQVRPGGGCLADALCVTEYSAQDGNGHGNVPRDPDCPPQDDWPCLGLVRGLSPGSLPAPNDVIFYTQNEGYPTIEWAGSGVATTGIDFVGAGWFLVTERLTIPVSGQQRGRIEQWITNAAGVTIKTMEYMGDLGAEHQDTVWVQPSTWFHDGASAIGMRIDFFDLTGVFDIFAGGNTTDIGGFSMWTHPRIAL